MASSDDLTIFHDDAYIDALRATGDGVVGDDSQAEANALAAWHKSHSVDDEDPGLEYDAPVWCGVWPYARSLVGGVIQCAQSLGSGQSRVAICWNGGRHHASKDKAAGFCYVADCVLAILELRRIGFSRVLYLDIDVHHGDGVQDAFYSSNHVMTVSFHLKESGFYPGTGSADETGQGAGKGFNANIPLKRGLSDESFIKCFEACARHCKKKFDPQAIVMQCGVDGLASDPKGGGWNLTETAYINCVKEVLSWSLPTMLLGGGGYCAKNAAIVWTHLTACAIGITLKDNVPEHDFLSHYGPAFDMHVPKIPVTDENDVDSVISEFLNV